jgi:hypothetical protein
MRNPRVQNGQRMYPSGPSKGQFLNKEDRPNHLQIICDQMIRNRNRTLVDLSNAWKNLRDASPEQLKNRLHIAMIDVLETLKMEYTRDPADHSQYIRGYLAALKMREIMESQYLAPPDIHGVICGVNAQYGVRISYIWWFDFLDSSKLLEWIKKATIALKSQKNQSCSTVLT